MDPDAGSDPGSETGREGLHAGTVQISLLPAIQVYEEPVTALDLVNAQRMLKAIRSIIDFPEAGAFEELIDQYKFTEPADPIARTLTRLDPKNPQ
jgi:hypothetical protein